MRNDKDSLKNSFIKRRVALIQGGYLFLTAILIIKLFKLQILDGLFYRKKANNNSLREEFLLPKRGKIYDRNGIEIANNIQSTKLIFFVEKKSDIKRVEEVYKILHRPYHKIAYNFEQIQKKISKSRYKKFILARNLTKNEITRLKFNMIYYNEIDIEKYFIRNYPYKNYTSALIGYVIGKKNTSDKVAKINNDYRIGDSGVEKIMEKTIGGKVGMKYNVINATGAKVSEILVNETINGENVKMSINQILQNKLSQLLDNKNGCATLLDVRTGAILAMASTPNIDPNLLSIGVSEEEWSDVVSNLDEKTGLFTNKNITASYPPGSTFKVISALTGLINGLEPNKTYNCTGEHKIGNRIFHCHRYKKGGHGLVDLDKAIAQSCNCYFYNLSQQISEEDIYDVAKSFGLGDKHLFDFKNEISGLVPNAKWKKRKEGTIWYPGDNANFVIGQGYTNVTPLQLAVMVARLATNKKIEPKYLLQDENESFPSLGFNEEHLNIVRHGLFSVINADYGIIKGIVSKKYQVCGKTGTAQVISEMIENKDMKSGKIEKRKYSHALFVGYAPFNNPRYAVSVVVEHGIGGAYSAAPIGTQILVDAIKAEN